MNSTQIKSLIMEQNIDSWSEKNIDREVISNLLDLMKPEQLPAMVEVMKYAIDNQVYPIVNPYARLLSNTPRHTPPELVRCKIEKIPVSFFSSKDTKFLDPNCGTGIEICEAVRELFDYRHSAQNIISRVTGFCENESYLLSAKRNLTHTFEKYGNHGMNNMVQ